MTIDYMELRLIQPELHANPNFEVGASGWFGQGAALTVSTTTGVTEGAQALKVTTTSAGAIFVSPSPTGLGATPVAAGGSYAFSANAFLPTPPGSRTLRIRVQFYDAAGTATTSVDGPIVTTSVSGSFSLSAAAVVPAGSTFMHGRILFQTAAAAGEIFYIDEWTSNKAPILLPNFTTLTYDKKYNDVGAIDFSYPYSEALTVGLQDQSLVSVTLGYSDGTVSEVDRYIIESTNVEKVSDDERLLQAQGRSIIASLDDASVYPSNWPVAAPTGHSFTNATPGTIWRTFILRALTRGCFPSFGTTFSGTLTTNGAAWTQILTQDFSTGSSYLATLQDMMDRGLVDAKMDGWKLSLYNGGVLGNHIAIGSLEVRPAQNVTEMTINTSSTESCSTVLIEGEEGTAVERSNAGALTLIGRRRERYVQQGGINDVGVLSILGDAELSQYARIPAEETVGIQDFDNMEVFKDFTVADWVWVRYEGSDAPVERRVRQIAVGIDQDRNLTVGLTLNSILYEEDIKLKRIVDGYSGGGGSYGSIPNSGVDNTVPAVPSGLAVSTGFYIDGAGQYQGAFVANWTAPTLNVDGTVLDDLNHYEVHYRYVGDTAWSAAFSTSATETTFGYSPVTPGRSIEVQVRAVDNSAHTSAYTATVTQAISTDTTVPATPSAPITTSNVAEHIEASWDGLNSVGGVMDADLLRVELWQAPTSGFTPGTGGSVVMVAQYQQGGGTQQILGGLYDQLMYYKLVAVDRAGNRSAPSVQSSGKRLRLVVVDPGTAPASSPAVEVIGGIGVLHVRWQALLSAFPLTYEVHVSTEDGFTPDTTTYVMDSEATAATIKLLRKNLAFNGSFEIDPLGWTPSVGALSARTDDFFVGTRSLQWQAAGTGVQTLTPQPSGSPLMAVAAAGDTIRMKVRAKGPATRKFYVNIDWKTAAGAAISTITTPITTLASPTVWGTTAATVTAPATTGQFAYSLKTNDTVNGSLTFDGLEIVSNALTEPLLNGVTYFVKIVAKVTSNGAAGPSGVQGSGSLHLIDGPDVSANYVYAGTVVADQIESGTVNADVTISGRFRTAVLGQRVEMDPLGLHGYGPDGTSVLLDFVTSPGKINKISGSVQANDLVVSNGMEIRGLQNIFAMGSKTVLQTTTSGSSTPAVASPGYEKLPVATGHYLDSNQALWVDSSGTSYRAVAIFFGMGSLWANGHRYSWPGSTRTDVYFPGSTFQPSGLVEVYSGTTQYSILSGITDVGISQTQIRSYDASTMTADGIAPTLKNTYSGLTASNVYYYWIVGRAFSTDASRANMFVAAQVNYDNTVNLQRFTVSSTGVISPVAGSAITTTVTFPSTLGVNAVFWGSSSKMGLPGAEQDVWMLVRNGIAYFLNNAGTAILPDHQFPANSADYIWGSQGDPSTNEFLGFVSTDNAFDAQPTKYTSLTWLNSDSSNLWAGYTWQDPILSGLQTINLGAATAGTVTITFNGQTTAAIAYNANALTIQTALEALSNIDPGDMIVTGDFPGTASLSFTGQWASQNLLTVTVTPTGLTGGTVTVVGAASTIHETNMSTPASLVMPKRARLTVTIPAYPDPQTGAGTSRRHDDVSAFRVYLGRGPTQPTNSGFFLQTSQPAPLAGYATYSSGLLFSGAATPPTATNFPTQASATLESSALGADGLPRIRLAGDGAIHGEAIDISGLGASALTGKAFEQLYYSIRAQSQLSGGGIKTVSATYVVDWSLRFLALSLGRGPNTATSGFFEIFRPAAGTIIPGFGGAPNATVTSAGIPLAANWYSLWYEIPYGSSGGSLPGNFRITYHGGTDFTIPNNWVLLAQRNGDTFTVEWATGENVPAGFNSQDRLFGTDSITPSAANVLTTKTITFPTAFGAAPGSVILQIMTGVTSAATPVIMWPSSITASNFVANLNRGNTTATSFRWVAFSS